MGIHHSLRFQDMFYLFIYNSIYLNNYFISFIYVLFGSRIAKKKKFRRIIIYTRMNTSGSGSHLCAYTDIIPIL